MSGKKKHIESMNRISASTKAIMSDANSMTGLQVVPGVGPWVLPSSTVQFT